MCPRRVIRGFTSNGFERIAEPAHAAHQGLPIRQHRLSPRNSVPALADRRGDRVKWRRFADPGVVQRGALSEHSRAVRSCVSFAGMSNPFRCFNSSPEVIRLVVMMYVRYPLSLRNVGDLLAEREIDVSYETVRFWWNRFGPMFAAEIRKRRVAHMRGYPQWR